MIQSNQYSALCSSAADDFCAPDDSAFLYMVPSNMAEVGLEHQLESHEAAEPSTELIRPETYSREQWEVKKPVIWRLYNVENKPYKRVVEILRTEHNFYLTRRQFYRKIDDWGFKKNVKDSEMRDIAQKLSHGASELPDAISELTSQRVNLAKIQRWQRKHQLATQINGPLLKSSMAGDKSNTPRSSTFAPDVSDQLLGTSASGSVDLFASSQGSIPAAELKISYSGKIPLSHWTFVDVPGSPNLSRLFKALKIECSEDIPPLSIDGPITASVQQYPSDSDSNQDYGEEIEDETAGSFLGETGKTSDCTVMIHSRSAHNVSPSQSAVPERSFSGRTVLNLDFSCGKPLNGMYLGPTKALSPFPGADPVLNKKFTVFKHLQSFGQMINVENEILQSRRKWLMGRRLWGSTDSRTLEVQFYLAGLYSDIGKFEQAESLLRRAALCLHKSKGFESYDALSAYLKVINLLDNQGKFRQADKIHHQVHKMILNVASPEEELCLKSNSIMAFRLYGLSHSEEANEMHRQILQIRLSRRGLFDEETLVAMNDLALSLCDLEKYEECLELLNIIIQLQNAMRNIDYAERFSVMRYIAWTLKMQGHHLESAKLAVVLLKQSETHLRRNHHLTLQYRYMAATGLLKQSRFEEGEGFLRELLDILVKDFGSSYSTTASVMISLASHLYETGRYEEAAKYYKILLQNLLKNLGVDHHLTIHTCDRLGRCFEGLGRYGEALSLYLHMSKQLGKEIGEGHPLTQDIRRWTVELQNFRAKQLENIYYCGGEPDGVCQQELEQELDDGYPKDVGEDGRQKEEWMNDWFDFQKMQDDADSSYG